MGSFPEQRIDISTPPHHPLGVAHHNVGFSLFSFLYKIQHWLGSVEGRQRRLFSLKKLIYNK